MKKYLLILLTIAFLPACESDDRRTQNPFLPDYNFSITINMDLPLYSPLNFTANPVIVNQSAIGISGEIIVMNTGSGFVAYDVLCPNQQITECSFMDIDGVNAVCPCDDVAYNLFTGLGTNVQYPMKAYRVEVMGPSLIRVYN